MACERVMLWMYLKDDRWIGLFVALIPFHAIFEPIKWSFDCQASGAYVDEFGFYTPVVSCFVRRGKEKMVTDILSPLWRRKRDKQNKWSSLKTDFMDLLYAVSLVFLCRVKCFIPSVPMHIQMHLQINTSIHVMQWHSIDTPICEPCSSQSYAANWYGDIDMPYQAPKRRNEPRKSPSRSLVAEMVGLGPWFQDMTKKDSLAEDEHILFTRQLDDVLLNYKEFPPALIWIYYVYIYTMHTVSTYIIANDM